MLDTKALIALVASVSITLAVSLSVQVVAYQSQPKQQPILVEFFTSEGCSSCPPSDRLASHLQNTSPDGHDLIILSEHVDYWNYLGWQDQYSSPQFTLRQQQYASALGQNSVYTPEAVIDGSYGVIGSEAGSVNNAITRCASYPKALLRLSSQDSETDKLKKKVSVSVICPPDLNGKEAALFLAVTEDKLSSNVRSGENAGTVLPHTGVVRYLKELRRLTLAQTKDFSCDAEITLSPHWKMQDLRIVAFLQDPTTRRICGATQARIQ